MDDGRTEWLKLDVGLLDDGGVAAMDTATFGAWIKAYLLQKGRQGRPFADDGELARLLRKEGVVDATDRVAAMRHMLEYPHPDSGVVGVRGFHVYQSRRRHPSDLPEAKAERNARRPTTRSGRRGASVERVERGGATDKTRRGGASPPTPPRPPAGGGAATGYVEPDPDAVARVKAEIQEIVDRAKVPRRRSPAG